MRRRLHAFKAPSRDANYTPAEVRFLLLAPASRIFATVAWPLDSIGIHAIVPARRLRPRSSLIVKRDCDGHRDRQHRPVRLATTSLRERVHHSPWMLTRRAGCAETCLSGSREARRSNPGFAAAFVWQRGEAKVIPTFYPMSIVGKRATRKCLACVLARPSCFKAGENPVLGVRTKGRFVRSNRVEVP